MGSQTQFGTGSIRKMSFLKAVGIASLAAFFCVGCAEKIPDGEGTDGDGDKKVVDSAYTKHIIEFDPNGGTVTPTSATTGADGKLASLPTPEKDGYSFIGWYTASTGGTQVTTSTAFNSGTIIYARWTEVPVTPPQQPTAYTITFNYNYSGSTNTTATTRTDGTLASLPTPAARTGYTFDGWFTAAIGGDSVALSKAYSENTTIFAQWKIKIYAVEFNSQNGSAVSSQSIEHGDDVREPTAPTRANYTFGGWYKDAACTNVWTFGTDVVTSAITLYAKWNTVVETFTDSRDNKEYKKVKIGEQTWMAQNLNYAAAGSKCYDEGGQVWDSDLQEYKTLSSAEVAANCNKYGRLYNWATAMGIDASYNITTWGGSDVKRQGVCPVGWHLPSDAEWTALMNAVGGESTAGPKLKATSGWYGDEYRDGNGTDDYGFSTLPGGYSVSDGNFSDAGRSGVWWSATEGDAYYAWRRYMNAYEEYVFRRYGDKPFLHSVRCVRD